MPRKPQKLPDYFTAEETQALVAAAPSYQVRMAMRVMLRTGLRVGECLSLRPAGPAALPGPADHQPEAGGHGQQSQEGQGGPHPRGLGGVPG